MRSERLTDGSIALDARRLVLAPGELVELEAAGEALVYVITGAGTAAGQPLAAESVVLLEPGETCAIEAGPDGIELLEGTGANAEEVGDVRDV